MRDLLYYRNQQIDRDTGLGYNWYKYRFAKNLKIYALRMLNY